MKPGNRHESEMVPIHTKQKLWKMREGTNVIYVCVTFLLFLRKGFYFFGEDNRLTDNYEDIKETKYRR